MFSMRGIRLASPVNTSHRCFSCWLQSDDGRNDDRRGIHEVSDELAQRDISTTPYGFAGASLSSPGI